MQTTLIITMVAIFLAWLYIQQKRLRAYEWYCMQCLKINDIVCDESLESLIDSYDRTIRLMQSFLNEADDRQFKPPKEPKKIINS